MKVTTIAALKASLSEFLAGVKAGEELIVTDRGRPVARIVPYVSGEAELDELARIGRVRRPRAALPQGFWDAPLPKDGSGRLLSALLEERETGR